MFTIAELKEQGEKIFKEYDFQKDGLLELHELYPAVVKLYNTKQMLPPPYNFIIDTMKVVDKDSNKKIDQKEFMNLLLILNGYPAVM